MFLSVFFKILVRLITVTLCVYLEFAILPWNVFPFFFWNGFPNTLFIEVNLYTPLMH